MSDNTRESKIEKIEKKHLTTENNTNNLPNNLKLSSKRAIKKGRKRVSLLDQQRLIDIPDKDPNFVYRLVNDEGNRISNFYDAGYEFVDRNGEEIDIDGRIQDPSWKQSVLSQPVGDGVIAYLMRMPKREWEEYQAEVQHNVDAIERDVVDKKIENVPQSRVYGGINYDSGRNN